jgi:hypothetical protein
MTLIRITTESARIDSHSPTDSGFDHEEPNLRTSWQIRVDLPFACRL